MRASIEPTGGIAVATDAERAVVSAARALQFFCHGLSPLVSPSGGFGIPSVYPVQSIAQGKVPNFFLALAPGYLLYSEADAKSLSLAFSALQLERNID